MRYSKPEEQLIAEKEKALVAAKAAEDNFDPDVAKLMSGKVKTEIVVGHSEAAEVPANSGSGGTGMLARSRGFFSLGTFGWTSPASSGGFSPTRTVKVFPAEGVSEKYKKTGPEHSQPVGGLKEKHGVGMGSPASKPSPASVKKAPPIVRGPPRTTDVHKVVPAGGPGQAVLPKDRDTKPSKSSKTSPSPTHVRTLIPSDIPTEKVSKESASGSPSRSPVIEARTPATGASPEKQPQARRVSAYMQDMMDRNEAKAKRQSNRL
ncbi:hypothetical protein CYMTET_49848 [Cymbomonas tetramitiformis]|uniref:Uncharacterized protein n=1 Tax=Cymbomonas tetramitiformis TaxID=36881 RepID=A0AAE0ETR1_9CHLO|nr:hypothetical protein CYMTET_49848 [Cymbomonas tetramitiformis]